MTARPRGGGDRARLDKPTRGKTASGRLRQVDAFLALYDPGLLRRRDGAFAHALFVDLGFGDAPATTLEAARTLRRLRPDLRVLGVEADRERVARARAAETREPYTSFRLGGFALPLAEAPNGEAEGVRLIRAFNVLRQYEEADAREACELMGGQMLPGGLLVEGTSDPRGRLWCASLLRQAAAGGGRRLVGEGLVFGLRWRAGFHPAAFRAVLPKCWHHRVTPGEPIHAFLEAWERAWSDSRAFGIWGPRFAFARTAARLAGAGYRLDARPRLLRRGMLVWRDGNRWPPL